MKELGNLAIVCARRPDVLMQIYDGIVSVHADFGSTRSVLYTTWDNDAEIRHAIHELNFGKYAEGGVLYDG